MSDSYLIFNPHTYKLFEDVSKEETSISDITFFEETNGKDLDSKLSLFKPIDSILETYTLAEEINNSIEGKVEPIKQFVQDLVNEKDIYLDTFFYPLNEKDSVLVVKYEEVESIMEELCNFCDLHKIIISLDNISDLSEMCKEHKFYINENVFLNELIIRHPQELTLSEGLILFTGTSQQVNTIELRDTDNLNSFLYAKDWYQDYVELIKSKKYKKERHKLTHGILVKRNAKKDRGCISKVGYAIVGKCKVK